jgi:hypothetical protein
MKRSVVVLPNKNKVAREDIQEARALLARKFLWELLAAAEQQVDVATWCKEGGLEAEDLLDAIDSGRPHPLLRSWEERKATVAANRPAPSRRELRARHLAVLLCAALERAGLGKRQARQQVSRLLALQSGVIRPASIRSRAPALAKGGTCTYDKRSMCYQERDGQRRSA